MRLFVWVPGILGSGLRQRQRPGSLMWPPGSVGAFQSRTYDQLTGDLQPDGVVQDVCGLPIYSTIDRLFEAGGAAEWNGGPKPALGKLSFPYDWRLGLQASADQLADRLDALTADGDEIVLLAHSMGGLVCRFLLEAGRYAARPFTRRVVKFVSVNGALLGAPVMLARALGLEPTQFIRWSDQPRLLATAPFSGAYHLLPTPREPRLFNGAQAIDIFDPYYHQALGLGLDNMQEATAFWTALLGGRVPGHVQYVLITSRVDDDATIERVRYAAGAWTREYGPGDGSVPPWSSRGVPGAELPAPLPGEHLGVIHTPGFRALFSQHVLALPAAGRRDDLLVQPLKQQLRAGSVGEISIVRSEGVRDTEGTLSWTVLSDRGARRGPPVRVDRIAIPDQPAPLVRVRVPDAPGTYQLTLTLGTRTASTRLGVRPAAEQPVVSPPAPLAEGAMGERAAAGR